MTDNDLEHELKHDPLRTAPLVSGPPSPQHRAQGWQIFATTVGALAIVALLFYGLNNQRDGGHAAGEQTAAQEVTPSPQGDAAQQQQAGKPTTPSTTGQAPNTNDAANDQNATPPKAKQ